MKKIITGFTFFAIKNIKVLYILLLIFGSLTSSAVSQPLKLHPTVDSSIKIKEFSNNNDFSRFIDLNGNLNESLEKVSVDKYLISNIDFLGSVDTSCISILNDTAYCDSNGTYVYEFQIHNNSNSKSLAQLEITVDSPQPPNYVITVPSTINFSPVIPPNGNSSVCKVNLTGPGAVAGTNVCFTITAHFVNSDCPNCCFIENCISLPLCDDGVNVIQDSLNCNNGQYNYNFTLQNGTVFDITKIQLTSPGTTPISFIPQTFHFGTPISPGEIFPNLTAEILGGYPGLSIPVRITLYSFEFQCSFTDLVYTLPSCDTTGSYGVIVSPGNGIYASLQTAFTAINTGLHGSTPLVTINSSFTEPNGAVLNASNITSCTIRPNGNHTITGSFNAPMISLNGADNVTIDGRIGGTGSLSNLILNNTNTGTASGVIKISNGANNNNIKYVNCRSIGYANTQGGRVIEIAQSTPGTGGNNNNIIDNCIVNGGRRGIQTFGTGGASGSTNNGTIIRNNKVKNASSLGIFIGSETRDNLVEANEIFNDTIVTQDASFRAINIQGVGSTNILRNKIYNLNSTNTSTSYQGIVSSHTLLTAPGSNASTVNIINNMVSITDNHPNALYIYGINVGSISVATNYTANVYFNTVRIEGISNSISTISIGVQELFSGTHGVDTCRMYNNIIINNRTGGDASSLHIGMYQNPVSGVSLFEDYNTLYGKSENDWEEMYAGILYKSSRDYKNAKSKNSLCTIYEQNTAFVNVHLISNSDLHLAGKIAGNMDAFPIASVLIDIDGDSRAISSANRFTYRGADEHRPVFGDSLWRKSTRTILFAVQGTDFLLRAAGSGIGGVDVGLKKKPGGQLSLIQTGSDTNNNNVKSINLYLGDSINTGNYEIEVRTTNTIRTFSSLPISFASDTGIYDFTASLSQAYGNNMYGSSPPYAVYTGDVNQDGIIDFTDVLNVYNASTNFLSGCNLKADINYDGIVDILDLTLVSNNADQFIHVNEPTSTLTTSMNELIIGNTNRPVTLHAPMSIDKIQYEIYQK